MKKYGNKLKIFSLIVFDSIDSWENAKYGPIRIFYKYQENNK
jgi:hypothetical protein